MKEQLVEWLLNSKRKQVWKTEITVAKSVRDYPQCSPVLPAIASYPPRPTF